MWFKEKYKQYDNWARDNEHIVQVSYQRSGRTWLSSVIQLLAGVDIHNLELHESVVERPASPNQYFTTHLYDCVNFHETAKYIFLVRDPRATIMSFTYYKIASIAPGDLWCDENVWDKPEYFHDEACRWAGYFEQILEMDTIVAQYEHILLWPRDALERIFRFTGLAVEDYDVSQIPAMRDAGSRAYYEHYGLRWQRDENFTDKHNETIWDCAGDTMKHYGYGREGHTRLLFNKKW